MARVYKHKKRGWQLRYLLYFQDGSQAIRYRYFHAREQATEACLEADRLEFQALRDQLTRNDVVRYIRLSLVSQDEALKLAGPSVAPAPPLADLAAAVLENCRAANRPKTFESDRLRVAQVLDHFGPSTPATEINHDALDAYINTRRKTVSAATVNKELTKLSQMLDLAIQRKLLIDNPIKSHRRLNEARGRLPRAMTESEIQALLSAADASRRSLHGLAYHVFMTYLYTGMRRSELLNLKWENVDLKRRRITVQADLDPNGFETKTRKARIIGVNPHLAEILAELPQSGPYVFGGVAPIVTASGITHCFMRIRRRAGLSESITLHSLRHSYISYLLESGVNPRRVQDQAGHGSYQTTQRYTHVLPSLGIVEDALPDFGLKKDEK